MSNLLVLTILLELTLIVMCMVASKNAKNSCLNVTTLFATFTPNMKTMILSNKATINYNNNKNNEDISLNYIAKLKYLLSVMKSPNDARGISRIFIK